MSIKLVALDMDGTLLNSKKEVPDNFYDWVRNHPDITTVIASGRQYYTLRRDFVEIKDKLTFIAENGGLVFKDDKVIYKNAMKREDVLYCIDLSEEIGDCAIVLCGVNSAYILEPDEEVRENVVLYYDRLQIVSDLRQVVDQDEIIKVAYFFKAFKAEASYVNFRNVPKQLDAVLSGLSWIDVANASVDKGAGIIAIQKELSISPDECMAFGDYLNDISLLENCTESYGMANGHPDLLKVAKYMTASNDEDGVMKVLMAMDR